MTVTFAPITVRPNSLCYELLLTGQTPLSHHDPAVQTESNRMLFNRQKQLQARPVDARLPDQRAVDALTGAHAVPSEIADLFGDLTFPEFCAAALVRLAIDMYNANEGTGLFSGMERYSRLEDRLRLSSVSAPNLRSLWNRLVGSLQVPIHPGDDDLPLLMLLAVPAGLQQQILRLLATDYRSAVALARLWHMTNKAMSEQYAAKAGRTQAVGLTTLHFDAAALTPGSDAAQVLEVPAVSGNSLRHQVVREPSWLHLCQQLGLNEAEPGKGPVPAGVEAIFYNGGNIAAGAKQPSNVFGLAQRIRAGYPSLDLLGGVTDSFDLGESRLQVAAWLVCAENRVSLVGSGAYDLPAASISVYDLLDDVTLTRQAGTVGTGQMIWSFETLCPGAQVLLRLHLTPYTPILTRGALVAAVGQFLSNNPTLGGQAARGFGHISGEWLALPEDGDTDSQTEYEAYLAAHRDELRAWLVDGTLGTGQRVLT